MNPEDLGQQLQGLLQQLASQPQATTPGSWSSQRPTAPGQVIGLAVPIKLETPIGPVRCYLSLGPEAAASEQTLLAALEQLDRAGFPIDSFGQGGNAGGWRGQTGWNRNRPYHHSYRRF